MTFHSVRAFTGGGARSEWRRVAHLTYPDDIYGGFIDVG
jgi:hypothetical protein